MPRPKVTVYTFTGRQGWIRVPRRICDACDLTVSTVRDIVSKLGDGRVDLEVRPWLPNLFRALAVGGWHPPVVVVDGRVVEQGRVPKPERIRRALDRALTGNV